MLSTSKQTACTVQHMINHHKASLECGFVNVPELTAIFSTHQVKHQAWVLRQQVSSLTPALLDNMVEKAKPLSPLLLTLTARQNIVLLDRIIG